MKHLRQFCLVATLVCACALSAYAGDIECTGFASPSQPAATGQVDCPALTEAAVSLIQSILALA